MRANLIHEGWKPVCIFLLFDYPVVLLLHLLFEGEVPSHGLVGVLLQTLQRVPLHVGLGQVLQLRKESHRLPQEEQLQSTDRQGCQDEYGRVQEVHGGDQIQMASWG